MPADPVRGRRWADHHGTLDAIAWKCHQLALAGSATRGRHRLREWERAGSAVDDRHLRAGVAAARAAYGRGAAETPATASPCGARRPCGERAAGRGRLHPLGGAAPGPPRPLASPTSGCCLMAPQRSPRRARSAFSDSAAKQLETITSVTALRTMVVAACIDAEMRCSPRSRHSPRQNGSTSGTAPMTGWRPPRPKASSAAARAPSSTTAWLPRRPDSAARNLSL